MDLIKKHYEKVILLGLFCLFLGLMFLVQNVINSTKEVKEQDLNIPQRKPDFVNEDPEDPKFKTDERRENTKFDWSFHAKNDNASDFIHMFEMAECPHCAEKNQKSGVVDDYITMIPLTAFSKDKRCPECGSELLVAKPISEEEMKESIFSVADKDRDGVDDEIETKYGMSPDNPHDARYDSDGDGFSNIFEIKNGFEPNNADSHPEYWKRLNVKKIDTIELPISFMALSVGKNPEDKSKWSLQFNMPDAYGRKDKNGKPIIVSRMVDIGGWVTIEGKRYEVLDVERRIRPGGTDANGVKNPDVDASRAILREEGGGDDPMKKLTMTINQPAKSNDMRPVIVDTGIPGNKDEVLRIGDTIMLRTWFKSNTGRKRYRRAVTYKLKSVDEENNTIVLTQVLDRNDRRSDRAKVEAEEVVLSAGKNYVPEKETPIAEVERAADNVNGPGM